MVKKQNISKAKTQKLEKDYELIFKNTPPKGILNTEWLKMGDSFTKLTVYQQYTPVRTSCSTTLFNKIQDAQLGRGTRRDTANRNRKQR